MCHITISGLSFFSFLPERGKTTTESCFPVNPACRRCRHAVPRLPNEMPAQLNLKTIQPGQCLFHRGSSGRWYRGPIKENNKKMDVPQDLCSPLNYERAFNIGAKIVKVEYVKSVVPMPSRKLFATESFSYRRSRLFIWNFFWKFQIQNKNPDNPVNPACPVAPADDTGVQ